MNIILVGMPAAGKTSMGRRLAKMLDMQWVDTDYLIREKYGPLDVLIINHTLSECEEDIVMNYNDDNTVVSTGGSVPLNVKAMDHLKETGIVVWLNIPLRIIKQRIGDPKKRGVLMGNANNVGQLYQYRRKFYQDCADLVITNYDYDKIKKFYNEQCG